MLTPEPFSVERAQALKARLVGEIVQRGLVFHDVGHGWTCDPIGIPGLGWDYAGHLVLPVLTLTVQIIASWSRYERASMLDVLGSDYIRTAKAKGLPRRKVVFKHAFRNALIPLITVMAIDAGALFGGLIITEYVFSIPGMGRFFIEALQAGDVDAVLAWMMVSAIFVILFNLLADLAYGWLDPRIRLT